MKKSTRELANRYADRYFDVSVVCVARNGQTATFREADGLGGRVFVKTRQQLVEARRVTPALLRKVAADWAEGVREASEDGDPPF